MKQGGLVLNRGTKETNNTVIIDKKLKITVKEISGQNVKLVFTQLNGERLQVDRGEKCP